jgi:hypothetical protein
MTDDLHPESIDDELRRRFAAGAPLDPDPDVVLDTMRPRLQRARTRRRASIATALGAAAVVVLLLLLVLGKGGGGSSSVRVPPATHSPVNTLPPAPSTAPSGGSATPDTVVSGGNGGGFTNEEPAPSTPVDTAPAGGEGTTTAPPTATQIVQAAYSSDGGSITVDFVDGHVSLSSSTPAAGFTSEVHDNGPTRVEVRFDNGQVEWRIRVDVVNGQLVPEITQH